MDDLQEIKGILEAALLIAGEPVPAAQLAKLFEPPLDGELVRKLLDELRGGLDGPQRRARAGRLAAGASRASRRSSRISTGCRRKSRRATRAR